MNDISGTAFQFSFFFFWVIVPYDGWKKRKKGMFLFRFRISNGKVRTHNLCLSVCVLFFRILFLTHNDKSMFLHSKVHTLTTIKLNKINKNSDATKCALQAHG